MVIFIQAKKHFTEELEGKVSFTSLTQMTLPDAIKWRAHNLFCLFTSPAIQIIWQTYQTLRITSARLEWKNGKQIQDPCSDLDFQTDHLLLDSIITLHTLMFFTWWRTDHNRELCALLFNEWCVGSLTSHRVEIRKICETESHVYGPKKSLPFAGVVTKAALSPQLLLWTRTPAWVTEPQIRSYTHWLTHSLTHWFRQTEPRWHSALRASP